MSAEILIVVPVLNRPQNARPLAESITETAAVDWHLLFICSPGDTAEIEECVELAIESHRVDVLKLVTEPCPGDYSRKIQRGYDANGGLREIPFVLLAADDLKFHPGWDTAALRVFEETGAGVVGTVDLGNRQTISGLHSTHPFVSREYIDTYGGVIDQPGIVYSTEYQHNFVDVELVQTAISRGRYAHAHDSVIAHQHWLWGKAKKDDTYRKGAAGFSHDRALYETRRKLWETK